MSDLILNVALEPLYIHEEGIGNRKWGVQATGTGLGN